MRFNLVNPSLAVLWTPETKAEGGGLVAYVGLKEPEITPYVRLTVRTSFRRLSWYSVKTVQMYGERMN